MYVCNSSNDYLFKIIITFSEEKHEKAHVNVPLFMSMLYSKIKIEIDTNNDELLETIWEYMKEVKEGEGEGGGGGGGGFFKFKKQQII
jgi:hypothetical protein